MKYNVRWDNARWDRGECLFFCGQVTSERDVKDAVDLACSKFGGLHVAVNCAGIGIAQKIYNQRKGPHLLENFRKVIEVSTADGKGCCNTVLFLFYHFRWTI